MKYLPISLWLVTCLLLAGCATQNTSYLPATTEPGETTAPIETTVPEPVETEEATESSTVPATEEPPQAEEFLLSFAGDCCMANLKTWPWNRYFIGTVGDDYDYPFANVVDFFRNDSCTFVNLENPLTDSTTYANKQFVFRGPTSYTQILTRSDIEFANVANNHALDCGPDGYRDTVEALDEAGIYYAEDQDTVVFTTEDGLTIGVYAHLYPKEADDLSDKIEAMRASGAELIIVSMHWGTEYYYKPNSLQQELAHAAIDAGADIVYGHHPHVLQPIEVYNGKIIYYSLGNFCFGGNTNPTDKDSAILQQKVIREPDGTIRLGELVIIPCSVSSVQAINDFRPTPYEKDSEAWNRVLSKLDNSYAQTKINVTYRPELD